MHFPPRSLVKFWRRNSLYWRRLQWQSRALPDCIILGAQKCGTSSLHWYLSQHPQLFTSPVRNEIHFFDVTGHAGGVKDRFPQGESWYRAHFPLRQQLPPGAKVFESTPMYLFHPLAPERMHLLLPEAKLVAILRNPVDRAISHYQMSLSKGQETLPMLEALMAEEDRLAPIQAGQQYGHPSFTEHTYKSRGRYAEQLERYLQWYSQDQLLVLRSEDLFVNPHTVLRRVFAFLGVNTEFSVPDLRIRNRSRQSIPVTPAVRSYLEDYFHPHNQLLAELIGPEFLWQ